MLLKDYKHAVYFVDRKGTTDPKEVKDNREVVIIVEAEVIIKRDGKYYAVPYHRRMDIKLKEYNAKLLNTFLVQCRMEMEKIDKNWIVNENIAGIYGKPIGQICIEL